MRFLQISAIALGSTSLVAAVPAQWTDDMKAYYKAVGEEYNRMLSVRGFPRDMPQCDLSKAVQPSSTLPAPTDLKLIHVALGRGTQNYTCNGIADDKPPAQVGAVATLYDGSCLASNAPAVLAMLPNLMLNYVDNPSPLSNSASLNKFSAIAVSGHHYFDKTLTPFFDLDTAARDIGNCYGNKTAAVPAPATASKGKDGQGFGAVPWLRLDAKKGYIDSVNIKSVYRLNTAGGAAPPTCGQRADKSTTEIYIQYASEYWFYT